MRKLGALRCRVSFDGRYPADWQRQLRARQRGEGHCVAAGLVILPVYAKRETQHDAVEQQLTAAGIPVIYIDTRVDLLHNTVPSLRLLGEVLNDQPKAARFITFISSICSTLLTDSRRRIRLNRA